MSDTAATSDRIYPRRLATAAAVVVLVVGAAGIAINSRDSDPVSAPLPSPTLTFAAAIEASGVLTSSSEDEVAQATDGDLYRADYFAQTQVSAAGNFVSLRRCRDSAASMCGTGWAYVTGVADGGEVHGGLLGEAGGLDLHLLDDRYFVASESAPGAQAPARAWLIDAVSGKSGALSWSDEPTTLNSPEQALLLCQESYNTQCGLTKEWDADHEEEFTDEISSGGTTVTSTYVVTGAFIDVPTGAGLPKVVDARDGTIRPLAMPDNVVAAGLTVAQHGTGRIWVGIDSDGDDGLGLAYSDDGGATWSEAALPEQLRAGNGLQIAADGDRVAAAQSWGGDTVYISNDAGLSWTTAISSEPGGNGAHLYVLADGRLVLMWSIDPYPVELLVSTGSDWVELEKVADHFSSLTSMSGYKRFSVNRAGIATMPSFIYPCRGSSPCPGYDEDQSSVLDTIDFSTDLTNWSTIEALDD